LFDTCTEITGYTTLHVIATNLRVAWKFQFLRLVHHICQCGIVQKRPGAKCLCTLGTAEDPQIIFLVPKIMNAFYAVPVPTWYSHWIFSLVYRTAKLFCELFHFVVYCREMFEMK